jgi:ubiquinone/menaquinone biosynthesis C-methylase UbiE
MTEIEDPEGNEACVIHELADFAGKHILEIGCGDGRLVWRYAASAERVLGLDPVEADIDQARRGTPSWLRSKVEFRSADVATVDLPSASFDVAVLGWSI